MMRKLRVWWSLDEAEEKASADNPLTPLSEDQRREAAPLLIMAFGWGFLITGLVTGGALGAGITFWPDLVAASLLGNLVNFVVGALVGYIGYQTACNSGLLYRFVYGAIGAYLPVLFLAVLIIMFQGIIVGAFGFAWAQDFDSATFYVVAIAGGIAFTATTYFGVKGLEYVSIPSVAVLLAAGLVAGYINVDEAGGWGGFLEMSRLTAAENPITFVEAINLVVGSWILGAIVMAEYTRFAKKAWVAIAIPFIVLIIAQWSLQFLGAMGGVVSGTADFTTYMLEQGFVIAMLGLIGMSLALWTTGDANLYLPVIQTSSVLKKPKRVMVVICGIIGTILGLGLYQHFYEFISTLGNIVPPLIGPVIVDYYWINRRHYDARHIEKLHKFNIAAVIAYGLGVANIYVGYTPDWMVSSLMGLIVSMVVYLFVHWIAQAANIKIGYAGVRAEQGGEL